MAVTIQQRPFKVIHDARVSLMSSIWRQSAGFGKVVGLKHDFFPGKIHDVNCEARGELERPGTSPWSTCFRLSSFVQSLLNLNCSIDTYINKTHVFFSSACNRTRWEMSPNHMESVLGHVGCLKVKKGSIEMGQGGEDDTDLKIEVCSWCVPLVFYLYQWPPVQDNKTFNEEDSEPGLCLLLIR